MSFLQQALLPALLLALLPIIIHLINQHRHRTVKWAAMMFLLDAKKMTKGMARIRQILILSMRVLAVAALILAASRPLASGWLALTAGGEPNTVIVLLDRSASMEQQNLETGMSKRTSALKKISDLLEKTARGSRLVLIESAGLETLEVTSPKDLIDLPAAFASDTTADIPELLQAALDYISTNQTGRTDVWVASDLRASDWQLGSGRWDALRSGFSELEGIQFYFLNYPDVNRDNLSISVSNLVRRRGTEGMELVMDLNILRQGEEDVDDSKNVPVELTINGARTVQNMEIHGDELRLQGHTVSLGTSEPIGWGRIDLPADANPRDNTYFFVFDEAPILKTVIVSDDQQSAGAIRAAAVAPIDSSRRYDAEILPVSRRAEVPWEETALLFWQAPLPEADSPEAGLLEQFVASGKSLVLLPPENAVGNSQNAEFMGITWKATDQNLASDSHEITWWRTDSGLLQNTQNGNPLPLGSLKIYQVREFEGETQSLLKLKDERSVFAKHINKLAGNIYIWGTLPRSSHSSLASDGVAFFAMIHRALKQGEAYLSNAQIRPAGKGSLPGGMARWTPVSLREDDKGSVDFALNAGAFKTSDKWTALNRPSSEDDTRVLNESALEELFSGLDYRYIQDSVDNKSSLAAEIWRAFLVAMALALIIEAGLCLPPKNEPEPASAV